MSAPSAQKRKLASLQARSRESPSPSKPTPLTPRMRCGTKVKRPVSLYLPAIAHNRLATYIANSLDGRGSFSGFIRFIEEQNYKGNFENAGDYNDTSEADGPYSQIPHLPAKKYWQPLDAYVKTWTHFTTTLPWYESNPTAAHVLALYALRYHADLWTTTYETKPEGPPIGLIDTWGGVAGTQTSMRHDASQNFGSAEPSGDVATPPQILRPILRRNRIELTDHEGSEPVSLHLDTEHHRMLHGPLGNRFYERLVHSLTTQLEDTPAEIDIEPAARFLELGPDGVSTAALEAAATRIAEDYATVRLASEGESLDVALKRKGYASTADPRLLSLALKETYTRIGEEESIAHLDSGLVLAEDLNVDALTVLRLGNQLGLIDGHPIAALPKRITEALRDRYGITEVTPSRENAFRLLNRAVVDDATHTFRNAVDMHMWGLFHLYAQHYLATATSDDPRLYRSTLSALSEPRLFLRLATLEAFTGATVSKERSGAWTFRKGRTVVRRLQNDDAIAIGNVLAATINVHDPITEPSWVGAAQRPLLDTSRRGRSRSIPINLEILDIAQRHLDMQGGDTSRAAQSLTVELLAETRRSSGTAHTRK